MALDDGIAALGAEQAGVLRAFHVEGRSTREIAVDKGISERAVEGRLRRARLALKQVIGSGGAGKEN